MPRIRNCCGQCPEYACGSSAAHIFDDAQSCVERLLLRMSRIRNCCGQCQDMPAHAASFFDDAQIFAPRNYCGQFPEYACGISAAPIFDDAKSLRRATTLANAQNSHVQPLWLLFANVESLRRATTQPMSRICLWRFLRPISSSMPRDLDFALLWPMPGICLWQFLRPLSLLTPRF